MTVCESALGRGGWLIDDLRRRAALLGNHKGSESSFAVEESYNDRNTDTEYDFEEETSLSTRLMCDDGFKSIAIGLMAVDSE